MAKKSAAAEITKLGKLRSPKGTAAYAYLKKPDTKFNKCQYRITVFFDKEDPEYTKFLATVKEKAAAYGKEIGRKKIDLPFKVAGEKEAKSAGVKIGTPFIQFGTKADGENSAPIPVFNAKGQEDEGLQVWGGDIVRVEMSLAGWELPTGAGVKGYLNAVQLLKSSGKGPRAGNTFEQEEEFLADSDAPESEEDAGEFEDESEEAGDGETEGDGDSDDPSEGLV